MKKNIYLKIFLNHVIWGVIVGFGFGFILLPFVPLFGNNLTINDVIFCFFDVPISLTIGIVIGFCDIVITKILFAFNKKTESNSILWALVGSLLGSIVGIIMLLLIPQKDIEDDFSFLLFIPFMVLGAINGFFIGLERNAGIIK